MLRVRAGCGHCGHFDPADRLLVSVMDKKERWALIEFIAVAVLVTVIAVVLIIVLLNWWYA